MSQEKQSKEQESELLHADTPEGVAFLENGLRNLEAALLAKEDWTSPEERIKALAEFYSLAALLRTADAKVMKEYRPQ